MTQPTKDQLDNFVYAAFGQSHYLNSAGSGNYQFARDLHKSHTLLELDKDEQALVWGGAFAAMSGLDFSDALELAEMMLRHPDAFDDAEDEEDYYL